MTYTRRQLLKFTAGAAFMATIPVPALAGGVRVETGPAFGSAWRLVLPDTSDAALARTRVEAIVQRIDALMSPFRADSEISRFNDAIDPQIELSRDSYEVLSTALDLAKASHGAFDPTVAPMVRRFGFGSSRISPKRPAGHFRDLRLVGRELQTVRTGLSLDLCAIAKGYAMDQMVIELDGLDFLIELGGEITARGKHPSGRAWRMGVERPGSDVVQRIVEFDGRAMATSGDAPQGYYFNAQPYSHIVDPRTRKPAGNGVAGVSVLAPNGQLADALATTAMVMGPGAAGEVLASYDASALFLMHDQTGFKEINLLGFIGEKTT